MDRLILPTVILVFAFITLGAKVGFENDFEDKLKKSRLTIDQIVSGSVEILFVPTKEAGSEQSKITIDFDKLSGTMYQVSKCGEQELHILVTPSYEAAWRNAVDSNGKPIKLGTVDVLGPKSPNAKSHLIDLDGIGLLAPGELFTGRTVNEVMAVQFKRSLDSVENREDGKTAFKFSETLSNKTGSGQKKLTYVFDDQKSTLLSITADIISKNKKQLSMLQETRWAENEGLSLPISTTFEQSNGQSSKMTFKWSGLNEPVNIPAAVEDMRLPKGTFIVDHRLGPNPVLVGLIGEEFSPPVETKIAPKSNSRFPILIVLGSLGLALGYILITRNARLESTKS